MSDLNNLDSVTGNPLNEEQIRGILAQIDLDITNLLRDGKLAAAKYAGTGGGAQSMDRATNLKTLLEARRHYQELLNALPGWHASLGDG